MTEDLDLRRERKKMRRSLQYFTGSFFYFGGYV